MKKPAATTIRLICLAICLILSACVWVPVPNIALYPLSVAAPEMSPLIVVAGMVGGAVSWQKRHRTTALLFSLCAFASAWPLTQLPRLRGSLNAQFRTPLSFHVFPGANTNRILPRKLPLGILFFSPDGEGLRPGVIDIYGGAWQRGSPSDGVRFHSYLASRGYAVFALDYRHAPAFQFPAQLNDVRAAVAWIGENASRYRTNPKRLALCGRSSGGQLALLAGYGSSDIPIRSVISIYRPSNLVRGYNEPPVPDPLGVRDVLEKYLGGTPSQVPDRYSAASPVERVRAGLPPTLLIHGAHDHIVKPEFTRELHQRLTATGNRSILLELPWSEHAYDEVFFGLGNGIALSAIEQFLSETLFEK